jgi:hypothetical protein
MTRIAVLILAVAGMDATAPSHSVTGYRVLNKEKEELPSFRWDLEIENGVTGEMKDYQFPEAGRSFLHTSVGKCLLAIDPAWRANCARTQVARIQCGDEHVTVRAASSSCTEGQSAESSRRKVEIYATNPKDPRADWLVLKCEP